MDYTLYFCDTETTAIGIEGDIIELSLIRLNDNQQKTWWLKPLNPDAIDPGALRVNGHKLEDLLWQTKEGKEKYKEPNNVLVEIENWIQEDGSPTESRILCGQNIQFDYQRMEILWKRCNTKDTFPFGRRTFDTSIIEFFMDWCKEDMAEGYSLRNLCKKYGVKNEKSHTAAADTLATKEVFLKQVETFKKILNKNS